jgi:hypothetical protein
MRSARADSMRSRSTGVEGPGWPLDREWADSRRHEQILFAARAVETDPSVIGFSHHFIAAANRP